MRKPKTFFKVLMVLISLLMSIDALAQTNDQITMTFKGERLTTVLRKLEKQSHYKFIFNYDDVNAYTVNGSVSNAKMTAVMDYILKDKPLKYTIDGKIISVTSKKGTVSPKKELHGQVVYESDGSPVVGATVKIKGTDLATTTNADGKFTIPVYEDKSVVIVSYVGMEAVEQTAHNNMVIRMNDDTNILDNVVVNGYYTQTKNSFTGSAKSYTQEELFRGSNQNILTALQNVDPSFVQVENNAAGSNPNSLPEFTIRGSGSLTGMSDTYNGNPNLPVFIVDGFETTAEKVFDMDPYRVKTITLLKDASATAIYGSRASNGVVVITTNTPKGGKLAVSYNMDATFYIPDLSAYNLCTPEQKLQLETLAGLYDSSKKTYWNMDKTSDQIGMDAAYNRRLQNIQSGVNTDWLAQPLHQVVVGQKHSVRIDGGSENFRYAMDLNYNNTPGVMKKSGRERMGLGVELQYIYKNITFRDNMTFSNVKSKNSPYGSFSQYTKLNSYNKMTDEDGNYVYMVEQNDRYPSTTLYDNQVYNPLYNTTLNYKDESHYNDLTNQFGVDWTIFDALRLKGSFAFTVQNTGSDVFKSGKHTDFATYTGDNFDRRGSYTASSGNVFNYDGSLVLSYFKNLGDHVINVNAGWNIQQETSKEYTVVAEGFPNDNLDYISFGTQYEKSGSPSGDEYTSRLMGFLGNVNYSWKERYLLDLSFREDASSRFGADKRWAPFWSAGIGWNIHHESFMKNVKWVDLLKLRATYGLTGSQNFDPYQAMTTYQYQTGQRYHYGVGATVMALGNDDLAWQRTHETNFGADLALFNNSLEMTFDYYIKNTKDLLTSVTLPPSLGFSSYMANLGEVQNKGWELSAKVNIFKGKNNGFYWSLFGTMIHNKNKLLKISDSLKAYNDTQDAEMANTSTGTNLSVPRVRYIEGESINSIWVNQSLGIDPLTGREIFLDKDGNKVSTWSADNYVIGGCTDPTAEGTFGTTVSFKGFQLNATFRYRLGGQMYNQTLVDKVQDIDPRYNADARALTDRWQKPGDIARYAGFVYDTYGVNVNQTTRPTSRFVEDYNYLTLSTLNLSYEFNNKHLLRYGIQRLKLLFYMNDVFFTSTVKQERGTDYPYSRNFSVGLNVRF